MGRERLWDIIQAYPKSTIAYDMRFMESEASLAMNIPTDEWYRIDRVTRENLIATRLARIWVDMISMES